MKLSIILITSLLTSVSSFATVNSQIETNQIQNDKAHTNKQLIKNLLTGMDFKVEDALIASANADHPNTSYNVTLQLVATDSKGKTTNIDLFTSDSFNTYEGYIVIDKEFHVPASKMFKILDPHINAIEQAERLNLNVSLNKNSYPVVEASNLKGALAKTQNPIYSTSVSFQKSTNSFNQEIDLPESFSYEENSDINDLGFGLFFR